MIWMTNFQRRPPTFHGWVGWQVTLELEELGISEQAIAAVFEVVALSDVADLTTLLGEDSQVLSDLAADCCLIATKSRVDVGGCAWRVRGRVGGGRRGGGDKGRRLAQNLCILISLGGRLPHQSSLTPCSWAAWRNMHFLHCRGTHWACIGQNICMPRQPS